MAEAELSAEDEKQAYESLAQNVLQRFVRTVLYARVGMGTWGAGSVLTRFYVALPVDSDIGLVRINDEDGFWTYPRIARSFKAGEEVKPSDIVTEFVPGSVEPPKRYISGEWDGTRWVLEIRLAVPHLGASAFLEAGIEFADAAVDALAKGRLRVFSENAFHAAEMLAKAELLNYVAIVPKVAEARTHGHVRGIYNRWANLGNTDKQFAKLLNTLDANRSSITYLAGDDRRDKQVALEQTNVLADMVSWVREIEQGNGPRSVNLVALRPLEAGQLVSDGDTDIFEPKEAS